MLAWFISSFPAVSQSITNNSIYGYQDSSKAVNLYNQSVKLYEEQKYEESLQSAESALQAAYALETSALHGDILTISGENLLKMGKHENSIVYLIRGAGIYERVNSPKLTRVNERIGDIFSDLNLHQKAGEYYDKVLQQVMKTEGETDPAILEKSAASHFRAENYETAELRYNELKDWSDDHKNNDILLRSLFHLADIHLVKSEYEKNIETNHILLKYLTEQNNPGATSYIYNNLGYTYVKMGDPRKASDSFLKAYELNQLFNPGNQDQAILLTNIGICYQNLNENDNALSYLHQALSNELPRSRADEVSE